jgi:hypothetical protein
LRIAASAIALLLLSCDPAVRRIVSLSFNDAGDMVTIAATTQLGKAEPNTPDYAQIEEERAALLAGRDEWSVRFNNADPDSDRVVMQRARGQLQAVEHTATIASENLQKFFFDTQVTVTFLRGEGWSELNIYPGASTRATRQQKVRVEKMMAVYAERAARYFQAVRSMYLYLEEKPQRATELFTAIFRSDKDTPPALSEHEESLTGEVRKASDALLSSDEAHAVDRDFDLVFNPFPAELKVFLRGEVLSREGFAKAEDALLVKTPTVLEAVTRLEGRWITPDPLAVALAARDETAPQLATATAALPRRTSAVVTPSEIADALVEKMRPASRYRVRWITKANAEPSRPPTPRPGSSEDEGTGRRNLDSRKTPALRDSTAALPARSF